MVFVAVKHIEGGQNKLVLIMNQLLQQLNVVRVRKMISSKAVDVSHEFLLPFGQWALRSLAISAQLLSKAS